MSEDVVAEDEVQGGNATSSEEHVCAVAGDAQIHISIMRLIARILRREMSLARAGGGNGLGLGALLDLLHKPIRGGW